MVETLVKPAMQGQLLIPTTIRHYVMGGNSTFTLKSKATGKRLTFKVKSATKNRDAFWSTGNQDRTTYFVSVLSGPDNSNDFRYIGLLKQHGDGHYDFMHTAKSPGRDSESFATFKWFWNLLEQGCHVSPGIEFWHEGSCCICGRKLTVPESVARGVGPECASKGGM
jgi:hypothetical protein